MMNDVLVIAQLDSSNEVLPLEPVHIGLLCHHEMNQLKKLQQKPDIHYQVEGDKSNDLIYSDSNHFGIIISHLLNNANKFTNQGSITLSYRPEEEGRIMCICVTDTGCGIPADKSEWIFECFTKNDDFIPQFGPRPLPLPPHHPTPQRFPQTGHQLHRGSPVHFTASD